MRDRKTTGTTKNDYDWGTPTPYAGSKSNFNRLLDPNNDVPIRSGQIEALISQRKKQPDIIQHLLNLVIRSRATAIGLSGSFEFTVSKLLAWEANWILGSLAKYKFTLKPKKKQTKKVYSRLSAPEPKEKRNYVNYYDYISSPEWKEKSKLAKQRAGNRCQVCNRPSTIVPLHTHHRTYERLGNEKDSDLTVLCEDCHTLFETYSLNRPTNQR